MAKQRGWWKINYSIPTEDINDVDLVHIANLIKEGYLEGEICENTANEDVEEVD
jgi:hypothetical protein